MEIFTGEFAFDGKGLSCSPDDGSFLLDGLLPALDFKDCLEITQLPLEGSCQTLNGLMLQVMGRLPKVAEKIRLSGWQREVVDLDGHRVDKVLALKHQALRDEDDDG